MRKNTVCLKAECTSARSFIQIELTWEGIAWINFLVHVGSRCGNIFYSMQPVHVIYFGNKNVLCRQRNGFTVSPEKMWVVFFKSLGVRPDTYIKLNWFLIPVKSNTHF